jgi:hypothetical protein
MDVQAFQERPRRSNLKSKGKSNRGCHGRSLRTVAQIGNDKSRGSVFHHLDVWSMLRLIRNGVRGDQSSLVAKRLPFASR